MVFMLQNILKIFFYTVLYHSISAADFVCDVNAAAVTAYSSHSLNQWLVQDTVVGGNG